mgnify:FL=1
MRNTRTKKSKQPIESIRSILLLVAVLIGLVSPSATAQQALPDPIPEQKITALQEKFATVSKSRQTSRTAMRRDLKNIARSAQALIDASPQAPNRFVLLELIFQSQKRLVAMDVTERNRAALFATCAKLADAPDEYAETRFEADLLLSEKALSEQNATVTERAEALKELIERYRGTAGEARSLMMGALIAQRLGARELEDAIVYAMEENFSDDHEVIEFRRKNLRINMLDVSFKGTFERHDGIEIKFPADTMGHLSLMVFWSKDKPGSIEYLDKVKERLESFGDRVDVFSFNLDELPDGGEAILREKGLDWTVMRLPGGRNHQAYRVYAHGDPLAVLVNEYGFSIIRPEIIHARQVALHSHRISVPRYMAQLQSLFIGDFLVTAPEAKLGDGAGSLNGDSLRVIEECFPPPPFRYRLSRKEALQNYRKAEKLCREAIEQNSQAKNLWWLRNRKIIALIGQWNLACDPRYLEKAVAEAKTALATELPDGADVVPRFCLAKNMLRREAADPEAVLTEFIEETGGQDAPPAALAAAAILALDAKSRDLHEIYRQKFLAKHEDNPDFYSFTAFLLNRHHRYRLLRANYARRERGSRGYIINHGGEPMTEPMPTIELKTPDGGQLTIPRRNTDKMTLLVFMEPPPAKPESDPAAKNQKGTQFGKDHVRGVMNCAVRVAEQQVNNSFEIVAAFLCDDAERVEAFMKENEWTCQAAMVPDGLKNPVVHKLGILSADRVANVFLLRQDGTIAWWTSGLEYQSEFGYPFALLMAMKVHIEWNEVERGYVALEKGEFKKAVTIFSGPFRPASPDRFGWRSPRYHGKTRALMGLKKWDAALESIDVAIDAHKLRHYRGRRADHAKDWRDAVVDFVVKDPCDIMAMLWNVKADILEKLDRRKEAQELRKRAETADKKDRPNIYKTFHERLKNLEQK